MKKLLLLMACGALAASTARAPELEAAGVCVPGERIALEAEAAPADPAQEKLARYLSRRFLVAAESTETMVGAAYRASREVGLDPLLLLAVIAVESRFNPIAESVMGAKGLMQIIPKYHRERLAAHGGDTALLDPESNILLGAQILQEYVYRTGTLEAGLQFYNGALRDAQAQYANKVLAERHRLQLVAFSKGT